MQVVKDQNKVTYAEAVQRVACQSLVLSDFDEIMEKVRYPVIWIGDFNAHNTI